MTSAVGWRVSSRPFAAHRPAGHAQQLPFDRGHQAVERVLVAPAPCQQQPGQVWRFLSVHACVRHSLSRRPRREYIWPAFPLYLMSDGRQPSLATCRGDSRAAIDLPETDRAAFVQQACAGDHDLMAEIVALLVAHANAGGFLAGSALGLESGTRSVAAPGVSAAGAAQRFAPGQIVGRYRIDRLLGRGGMGEVYSADEIEHGRRVALKVLSGNLPSLEDRDRFLREGRLASAITHPNSVYVFGSDIIDGHPVIVMELLGGGTLKDRVLAAGRLPSPKPSMPSCR